MLNRPGVLLRIEGGLVLAAGVLAYKEAHDSWRLFAVMFLAPDLSMLGYLLNVRTGAALYNFIHTYTLPILLVLYSLFTKEARLLPYALIWTAHIGMDRLLGFGLKYPTRFNDTHLQRV